MIIDGIMVRFLLWKKHLDNYLERKYSRTVSYKFWKKNLHFLGEGTKIFGRVIIVNPNNVSIGKNCTLNEGVYINARRKITINDYVRISPGVTILTGGLKFDTPPPYIHFQEEVEIGPGTWIATGVIILPGIKVGKNCVIAAGAVVTKDVEDHSLVGGIPARLIKKLPQ